MSRDLTSAMADAIAADTVRPALLFEGQFATGWVRVWTGRGPLVWGGHTWTGMGVLIGLGDIEETTEVVAAGVQVQLSGVPTDLVSLAIQEARQGLPGQVYLAALTEAGAVVADPVPLFAGRLDVPEIQDNAETCTVAISYESRLIDLGRPREWRYTHESQQTLFPGDMGFEYVTAIQDMELVWGRQ